MLNIKIKIISDNYLMFRGGSYNAGITGPIFNFYTTSDAGGADNALSFRTVLTPKYKWEE